MAGDMVVQWNEQLLDAIRIVKPAPPVASRAMAIVHTAVFDAVNSICNGYTAYATMTAVHPKASQEAAVAAAAERTLSALFPTLQSTFSAALVSSLATVPDGIREDQGIDVGRLVADRILAARADDGSVPPAVSATVAAATVPGVWRPTPPGFGAPVLPHWGQVTPFGVTSATQFLPPAPPALDSVRYAFDYNKVKELGALNSTVRTSIQTDIARIWAGGPGTATPPGQWNMIAQDLAVSRGVSLYDNARMFAALNVALADAAITCWNGKYLYDFWRPISAIQEGDLDSNPATVGDATWTPLLNTPSFPAYTSGHSTFSGAASTVLTRFFGTDSLSFSLKSEVTGVADRYYSSLKAAADEAGYSRIYGGIHYNFDNLEGLKSGRGIGDHVATSLFQPQKEVFAGRNGHDLIIAGTKMDDNITVIRTGASISVRNHGRLIGMFGTAGLWNIVVNGASGNDRIDFGGNGTATAEIFGGDGNDKVFGTCNRNWIYGEDGDDVLCGGSSSDVLRGGAGDDLLYGLAGDDELDGDDGLNSLYGGLGADILWGVANRDRLFGGAGNNQYRWRV